MSTTAYRLLTLLLTGLASLNVFSQQSIDLLTLSGKYSPESPYQEVDGKATEQTFLVNLKAPIEFKNEKTIWYTDVTYTYFRVNPTVNFADSIASPVGLHGILFQTGLVQRIDDTRAIQILLAPRLMSDFNNMDSRSIQPGIIALFEKKYSERLLIRFGAMYNQDLFGPMLVPLVYLDWQIGQSKWFVSGLVPIYSKIGYRFSEDFSAGVSHFGLVTSFALGGDGYDGDYMERKSIDITAFGRHRLAGNFHLEARFGYALSRDYGQYAGGDEMDFRITVVSIGENRNRKNYRFDDGLIANLRLVYNYPLK